MIIIVRFLPKKVLLFTFRSLFSASFFTGEWERVSFFLNFEPYSVLFQSRSYMRWSITNGNDYTNRWNLLITNITSDI